MVGNRKILTLTPACRWPRSHVFGVITEIILEKVRTRIGLNNYRATHLEISLLEGRRGRCLNPIHQLLCAGRMADLAVVWQNLTARDVSPVDLQPLWLECSINAVPPESCTAGARRRETPGEQRNTLALRVYCPVVDWGHALRIGER